MPIVSDASFLNLLPFFSGLGSESQKLIQSTANVYTFKTGQLISSSSVIGSDVLWLASGRARLLARDHGRLTTCCKLRQGDVVGLASLLRADPCEEVSASGAVEAVAIPDSVILRLLEQEPAFYQWCTNHLFPAELLALLQIFNQSSAGSSVPLQESLVGLVQHSIPVEPSEQSISGISDSYQIYCSSKNINNFDVGSILPPSVGLPDSNPPLPCRLVGISKDWFESTFCDLGSAAEVTPSRASLVPHAGSPRKDELPEPTAIDLGSRGSKPFSLIKASGSVDECLACFQMLSSELNLPFRRDAIERILRDVLKRGQAPDLQLCGNIASAMGLHVTLIQVPASRGTRLQTPALIPWADGFAYVRASNSRGLQIASPSDGLRLIAPDQLEDSFPGGISFLLFERRNTTPDQRFDFAWFWPSLRRYKGILLQVLLASFVVQLFSLANPLLIQVIIDKVISQRSLDTLQVLGVALVVVTILEGLIGSLRTFLFTETTNRIDISLGAEVIDHLLRLPLNYFDRRPVGELGTRIAELEKIRNFLTGQALTTTLDALFSVIYVIVMILYSWLLTLVALCVLPIQVALTIFGAPLFRRQYRESAQENARTQSHLVEVITGIQTVKAQNVETISRWKWQDLYNKYIARSFEKTITRTILSESTQVLQKLSQLLVLWVGATLVLKGQMSLGQLIAFRIISGYVTQPMLRLSSIWQSIQELKVSFERLADVVDTPEESDEADKQKIPLPPITGGVEFRDVDFSFESSSSLTLSSINVSISPGQFVGIVGQSGSGKSTFTKLLSRLYSPTKGRVLIDGYDIEKTELYSLRRQIGIVPQEPLLFSGSVSENIALTDPDASSEAIVEAAKMACAHDFIMDLPGGYSAKVGERGSSLSGGQRQRIALARTLLSRPRLLVLDEATSALDYNTEKNVCQNLFEGLADSTVFFVTHRLSTVKRADFILMMHDGSIVESGSHDELLELRGRYYALYQQQESF